MDNIDYLILRNLYENCRISNEALGRLCNKSTASIRGRIQRLERAGILGNFAIRLNSMSKIREVLVMLETYNTEDEKQIVDEVGNHKLIDCVAPCSDGRYFARASCEMIDDYPQLQQQLAEITHIKSVELFLTRKKGVKQYSFSKLQKQVLEQLISNPKQRASAIAKLCGRSAKGVRNAIRKLCDSGTVCFTFEHNIHMFVAILGHQRSEYSFKESDAWIEDKFNRIFEIIEGGDSSISYVFFALNRIEEISNVQREIERSNLILIDSFIVGPWKYFHSQKHIRFQDMIQI